MLWAGIVAALAIAAVVLLFRSGLIDRWLAPGFHVAEIHSAERTMLLRRADHSYLVRCNDSCITFQVGTTYQMEIVGGEIRYRSSHAEISLPVLEEKVGFSTPGGRG
jgi:hypothetical protein